MALEGRRIAVLEGSQTSSNGDVISKINDASFKILSGQCDKIVGRDLYAKYNRHFQPVCKVVLCVNDIPEMSTSKSMMNRFCYVHFPAEFVENPIQSFQRKRDVNIRKQMEVDYLDEIFTFMVRGAIRFYADDGRLLETMPEEIKEKREEMIYEMDTFKQFLQEGCEVNAHERVRCVEMYKSYQRFCLHGGIHPIINNSEFKKRLKQNGYHDSKIRGNMYYKGLIVKKIPLDPFRNMEGVLEGVLE